MKEVLGVNMIKIVSDLNEGADCKVRLHIYLTMRGVSQKRHPEIG